MLKNYHIISELARSDNSTVFLAYRQSNGQKVILKAFRFDEDSDMSQQEQLARFKRECDIHLFMKHPRVVPAIDAFVADNIPYLVTEYKPYPSLRSILENNRKLSLLEALSITQQICQALHYIHDLGIIHRDIKPQNILISEECQIFLTDFGCARKVFAPNITQGRILLGTPYYMSPEQLMGKNDLDVRTDIFSAGVILYQLLSSHLPFQGQRLHDILQTLLFAEPTPIQEHNPHVPKRLSELVDQTLQKDRDLRMPSAIYLAHELEKQLEDPNFYYGEATWHLAETKSKESAKEFCVLALQKDGNHVPALKLLGELFLNEEKWVEARQCYQRVVDNHPHSPDCLYALAQIDFALKLPESALALIIKAMDLDPETMKYQFLCAQIYAELGHYSQAETYYASILETHPQHQDALQAMAYLSYQQEHKEKAITYYKELYQLSPENHENSYQLAALYHELGYYHESLKLYQSLFETSHRKIKVTHNLANLYYHMGELNKARELLEELITSHQWPSDKAWFMSYRLLGFTYSRMNMQEDAIDVFKHSILAFPDNLDSYLYLSFAYRENLQLENAVQTLQYAAELPVGKSQAPVYFLLAKAYYLQGKEFEAIQALKVCLKCKKTLSHSMAEQAKTDLEWLTTEVNRKYQSRHLAFFPPRPAQKARRERNPQQLERIFSFPSQRVI